jgi:ABC-type dipeptide/oligopeptide/nickel transport system permease subunit
VTRSRKSLIISIPIAIVLGASILYFGKQIDSFLGHTSAANYLLIVLIVVEALLAFLFVGWIKGITGHSNGLIDKYNNSYSPESNDTLLFLSKIIA